MHDCGQTAAGFENGAGRGYPPQTAERYAIHILNTAFGGQFFRIRILRVLEDPERAPRNITAASAIEDRTSPAFDFRAARTGWPLFLSLSGSAVAPRIFLIYARKL